MKRLLFLTAILSFAGSSFAQFSLDYLRAADEYFRKGDYYSAAIYYEKYLAAGKTNTGLQTWNPYNVHKTAGSSKKETVMLSNKQMAVYNVAESYRMLNYPAKAEPAYREAVLFDKTQFPLARFWHSTMLRALGNYAEAEAGFKTYLQESSGNSEYAMKATKELANLEFIQAQLSKKDILLYSVSRATQDTGAFYAPVVLPDNTMYLTSTMAEPGAGKNNKYTNSVYQAVYSEGMLRSISKVSIPEDNDVHQGVVALTPDGNTMFLTRWVIGKGTKTSSIYKSTKSGDKWSAPEKVGGNINAEGANSQEPFVMPDGKKLLFSSNRSGGNGGYDLYISNIEADGSVSNAVALTKVNTKEDERAPYYHAPSGKLVFSSNGYTGMGGFDFMESTGTLDNLSTPVNLGYPVNSIKDDLYFTSGSKNRHLLQNVMISSDRDAACCLQIFAVNKQRPLKQLSGIVVPCDNKTPIVGATVVIKDPATNSVLYTKTTDMSGRYNFTLEDFSDLRATATFGGFEEGTVSVTLPGDIDAEQHTINELCLTPITLPEADVPVVLENVYYDYDKWVLKPESYPELDKLVTMLNANPNARIELSAHTDSKGTDAYNNKLSERRAISVLEYLVSKGIDKARLEAKGYGETMPVAPNTNEDGSDNPAGREKNRRTEFKVLK